jgi:hypothetical protein
VRNYIIDWIKWRIWHLYLPGRREAGLKGVDTFVPQFMFSDWDWQFIVLNGAVAAFVRDSTGRPIKRKNNVRLPYFLSGLLPFINIKEMKFLLMTSRRHADLVSLEMAYLSPCRDCFVKRILARKHSIS